jgi:hypothetical protein
MAHRVAPIAEADLDEIWFYVAKESGSGEMANRVIDTVTDRFLVLAGFPHIGRSRDEDFGPDAAARLWANMSSFTVLKTGTCLSCVLCMAAVTWTPFSAAENAR